MIIDFSEKIIDILTGKPLENEDKTEMTLKNVACNSFLAFIEGEQLDGKEKADRYAFALKILKEGKFDLKAEEIAKLKELIGKIYSVKIVGQAYEILEGKREEIALVS